MFGSIKRFFLSKLQPISFYKKLLNDPRTRIFTIIFTLIYLVNPFDVIPDFIPVIGWIDDLALIAILTESLIQKNREKKRSSVDAKSFRSNR
ncbi:MAG: DUF1232 domain-containing protein [candidate division SR1 bacterium]|nr:DUF1232 domain-containing protein [candidate division SR1 bacterium]